MSTYGEQTFWILIATFALSIVYELYRATVKANVSEHDNMKGFVMQLPFYVIGFAMAGISLIDATWAASIVFAGLIVFIVGSIFYYNPTIQMARKPDYVDWFEDLVFTGLLFVAAFLMAYELFGTTLTPAGG